jgi:methylase of polypeptide subunit release factors
MERSKVKREGIHYTPPGLASFLADATVRHLPSSGDRIEVLDPSCGSGALLYAFAQATAPKLRKHLVLVGYEKDADAIETTRTTLAGLDVAEVVLEVRDFLELDGVDSFGSGRQLGLFSEHRNESSRRYDAVIANPPYVRTQVLGAKQAQALAERFRLTGRVDLYHAFTKAMAHVLRPGGVLGLLTSNRFLTVRSGEAVRRFLETEFDLQAVFDLGDTRLFSAAVLPVIVVGKRRDRLNSARHICTFVRVYECRTNESHVAFQSPSVLEALRTRKMVGVVQTDAGRFRIERGVLQPSDGASIWSLSTPEYDEWLQTVESRKAFVFDDISRIRVGIKTTADEVFVRSDWTELPDEHQPEAALLHPLITHHKAGRWIATPADENLLVLYPHTTRNHKRVPIELNDYPRAKAYFIAHEARLRRRHYVLESGRRWYEIWVPHQPSDWRKPKIAFPDIAEEPRFFLDQSGAIVQGDCYWITLKDNCDPDRLFLMLAIANSSFITKYYDIAFHNKLYAGRRRFMTQYVKRFPIPQPGSPIAGRIIQHVKGIIKHGPSSKSEQTVNGLVWEAFGLSEEIAR